jgi:hypothetical protein
MGRWNPLDHPRDRHGKFRDKIGGKVTGRISARSATVQYGIRRKVTRNHSVYVGGLARIERDNPYKIEGYLNSLTNAALVRLAKSIPHGRTSRLAEDLVKRRTAEQGGVTVGVQGRGRRAGSVKASTLLGKARNVTSGDAVKDAVRKGTKRAVRSSARSPNRKPRTRSTAGKRVQR